MLSTTRRHLLRDEMYVSHLGRMIHHSNTRPRRAGDNRPERPPGPITDRDRPVRARPSYESLRSQVLGDK